jgi:hypothetical protein
MRHGEIVVNDSDERPAGYDKYQNFHQKKRDSDMSDVSEDNDDYRHRYRHHKMKETNRFDFNDSSMEDEEDEYGNESQEDEYHE